ncbi:MAG: endonuclease III [Crenarchaeota archaeon]|nr:endonuclease III [Thermoproteota archaeon]
MEKDRAAKILKIFKETLALPDLVKPKSDPFETLVITIISQNTADRNTIKAFENLSQKFKIVPGVLVKAPINQIECTIKPAGLSKAKALAIKQAAKIVLYKHEGTFTSIFSMPTEEARNILMQIPGVGPKTADVVLLFSANKATIPVDTHVKRVSKRLGFAAQKSGYETIRKNLQSLFPVHDYYFVHLLFISHGRKTCKALRPLCRQCSINQYCPSTKLGDVQ